jgi:hypothetical protein
MGCDDVMIPITTIYVNVKNVIQTKIRTKKEPHMIEDLIL